MDNLKLVNFDGFEEKAKRLGIECLDYSIDGTFAYIDNGQYWTGKNKTLYCNIDKDVTEITQADFLALEEPLKDGDWVIYESNTYGFKTLILLQEIDIEDKGFTCGKENRFIRLSECTKLTDEQIKVLGLGD